MSKKDTALRTLGVAAALCVFFSIIVSTTSVLLKPKQEANKILDVKKNILASAGLLTEGGDINELFKVITPVVVNLDSGDILNGVDPATVVFEEDISKTEKTKLIPAKKDIAGIRKRLRNKRVYLVKNGNRIEKYILHLYGKGLWSTMYGFIVLKSDGNTVEGFSFYQQGETPGLGGEVDNPKWKDLWKGKKVYNSKKEVSLKVIKGTVDTTSASAQYEIDGLSGATITSTGVKNAIKYWLGADGYKNFLSKSSTQTMGAE